MRLKILIASVFALSFSVTQHVYAKPDNYYPPERINCKHNHEGNIYCNEFNRQYLVEDPSNRGFEVENNEVFHFLTAASYTTPSKAETMIFFTYTNSDHKVIRLKTIHTSILPDVKHGSWKKFNEDIFTCDAGYMHCPITNLPY